MADGLFLGRELGDAQALLLDPDHLTTHAVCLGMTGSGKTGLGIVALEELARRRVPLLVVDLKGDMVNLLLTFPSLNAAEFRPWLPADAAVGRDPAQVAKEQAKLWRDGLARDGLGPPEIEELRQGLSWQLVTPGLSALAPLDILPALSPPAGTDVDADPDGTRDRVDGLVSSLLSLVGRGGDPLTDRDHVLVATTILEHWRRGESLDLLRLLGSLVDPPMATLGAFAVDTFYPRDERMRLVFALNTLVASPAFKAWTEGLPLTMEALLGPATAPRGTILSIAHLDTRQRLFVLGLLFSELASWMRRQPAASGLRALVYLDEVQGILPPHPAQPPTKGPLLTLLKQGRAFGVGVWLATQNPVDLDYKALGNAGVKLIGRLITDRDRERALEGLGLDRLDDGRRVDPLVAGLDKRQFVLHDVRARERVRVFVSRWAMSYLRGPVTVAEMAPLVASASPAAAPPVTVPSAARPTAAGAASPPVLAATVTQRFMAGTEGMARPWVRLRCRLSVERSSLQLLRSVEESWRLPVAGESGLDLEAAEPLEEPVELSDSPPPGMRFPTAAPRGLDDALARLERDFVAWRARRPLVVLANPGLKLVAEPGESREAFLARSLEAADRADDRQQELARERFERRMDSVRKRLERERDELDRDATQLSSRRAEEKLGVVEGLFSVLMGSRSLKSATGKAASKLRGAASKRRMRQQAEASVEESEREIERLERELEELAAEMTEAIDAIAAESEERAARLEEVPVRPRQADVVVLGVELVWG